MLKSKTLLVGVLAAAISFVAGCEQKVERLPQGDDTVLDERINTNDLRNASAELANRMVNHPWVMQYTVRHPGRLPIICLLPTKNSTDQLLYEENITVQLQEQLINSGKVYVMTERELRSLLRVERDDSEYTAEEYRQKLAGMATETKPDYLYHGKVVIDRERAPRGSRSMVIYQISGELMDVQSGLKPWVGSTVVKKGTL